MKKTDGILCLAGAKYHFCSTKGFWPSQKISRKIFPQNLAVGKEGKKDETVTWTKLKLVSTHTKNFLSFSENTVYKTSFRPIRTSFNPTVSLVSSEKSHSCTFFQVTEVTVGDAIILTRSSVFLAFQK